MMAANFDEVNYAKSYRFFGQSIGAMLRAGVDMPHFRFALHYHITGGGRHENLNVNFSYLAFTVAVSIGGGRVD
jgi:hypothetical protein